MNHIAILGGGIAGLTAAYELEKARRQNPDIDWHLYESTNRLGGIIATDRLPSGEANFILEAGPDAWVTEKPHARDLAIELGLKDQLVPSNDAARRTWIYLNGALQPIPDHMRMMVPTDLSALDASPLFSATAKEAYAAEITRAESLKAAAPNHDESVAAFTLRHFGEEVLTTLAAPLLSGVFGGDVHKLSVRAVMPAFVTMEREHGSLILALQHKRNQRGSKPEQPIFTTLRNGMATLTEALIAKLPRERLHLNRTVLSMKREGKRWLVRTTGFLGNESRTSKKHFHHVFCALPTDATRNLLHPLNPQAAALLPTNASSAILAAFAFNETFPLPQGFGFLAAQNDIPAPQLLATTFVDQKFPARAPANTRILRAFFGGHSADTLTTATDATIAQTALAQLQQILGILPDPTHTTIYRWPRSLPQYEVGHLDRIAALDKHIATLGHLALLGNSYRGVGLPDLIHHSQTAVRKLIEQP